MLEKQKPAVKLYNSEGTVDRLPAAKWPCN
jgi:hypothetical protein